jgi:bifunctional enzyme CysN/CysC
MVAPSAQIATDITGYLDNHENKTLLRFITCGSVDDGKSTLIGRLLYESKLVFEDQLAALEADSLRFGTQGSGLDFALLVDGLSAEREQGITIDVAYRFFATERRKFIVADTPGHEQYTRNMVTGASTADLAVILIDARRGMLVQTRRHSFLVSLLGIRNVVVAVNKLDLLDYSEAVFNEIEAQYRQFAALVELPNITCIPISAVQGDNVTTPSPNTPWYHGPTLMELLETVETEQPAVDEPFRLPVQYVNRPDLDFRGFSGTIARGSISAGDEVVVLPAGTRSRIARVLSADGELGQAIAGQAVTITLADEVDVSRGDLLSSVEDAAHIGDQFEAHLIWMSEQPMMAGRSYLLKHGTRTVGVRIARPKYKINVNTLEHAAATALELNEIGVCNLSLDQMIGFDTYLENRAMGGFIIIDRDTNSTVAAGLLHFALRRSENVHWQAIEVNQAAHVTLKGHRPAVVWLTGISGAGKSTIGNVLEQKLHAAGCHTFLLDGDNVRHGLNRDLGFTEMDRVENIRRVSEVARLMVDAGLIVIVSLISPFRADRQSARAMFEPGEFCEVFIDTAVAVAESRDRKGLYAKARRGELPNFTGIDSPYEAPIEPEVHIATSTTTAQAGAELIVEQLHRLGVL